MEKRSPRDPHYSMGAIGKLLKWYLRCTQGLARDQGMQACAWAGCTALLTKNSEAENTLREFIPTWLTGRGQSKVENSD